METKKSDRANLDKKRSMFFEAGLLLALCITFLAFEWQIAPRISEVDWEQPSYMDGVTIEIPVTRPEQPAPPPVPNLALDIVDDTIDLGDLTNIMFDFEGGVNLLPIDSFSLQSIIEDDEPIHEMFSLDEQILFDGQPAEEGFRNFIGKNLRYPQLAIDHGISGRVFVQFVVDQRGNVVDIQVLRGVDSSLENEAVRIIRSTSGRWTAGQKDGKPVKSRYVFPIVFRLQ